MLLQKEVEMNAPAKRRYPHPGIWLLLGAIALTILAFILFPYTP